MVTDLDSVKLKRTSLYQLIFSIVELPLPPSISMIEIRAIGKPFKKKCLTNKLLKKPTHSLRWNHGPHSAQQHCVAQCRKKGVINFQAHSVRLCVPWYKTLLMFYYSWLTRNALHRLIKLVELTMKV
jgi:hypothetical protein